MQNKKKGVVAISIFSFLFISGWWLNEINERYFHIQQKDDNQINVLQEEQRTIILQEPYRPREYIRAR